jgi:cell wall-associated NlpC family hydrolase
LSRQVKRVPDWDTSLTSDSPVYSSKINDSLRDSIVAFGMELLGTPYVTGGCIKNGFDCSGFVFLVFRHFNIQVTRSSSQFANFGEEIPVDSLSTGDILVFLSPSRNVIGHLGIVTKARGMESEFIHASSGNEMKVI